LFLHFPPPQKIHNVDVALGALKEKGILSVEELNSVNPRHIVDGHREKTLSLLWMIILHFQVLRKWLCVALCM
jgi:abnormal spindle-like microcephaly-associated protein